MWVGISQHDNCQGRYSLDIQYFSSLSPGTVKISGNKASLDLTLTAADSVSGASFPITIKMNWLAQSQITQEEIRRFRTHLPDRLENGFWDNELRAGDPWGSVSFQGTTIELSSPYFAYLFRGREKIAQVKLCPIDD